MNPAQQLTPLQIHAEKERLRRLTVLNIALATLQTRELARGTYAYKDGVSQPCGLHSVSATHLDLASCLWLAAEAVDETNHQQRFHEAWTALREHIGWNTRTNNKDATLCRWLDNRSKAWHVMVLEQMTTGQPYVNTRSAQANVGDTMDEYV